MSNDVVGCGAGAPEDGISADPACSAVSGALAEVLGRWFLAMRTAIGRERARAAQHRLDNGLPKSAKVPYVPPAVLPEESSCADACCGVLKAMFGDRVAGYAMDGYRRAIATGDMRSFKIRLIVLKARDSISDPAWRRRFAEEADACISRAEGMAGCIPCPGPRRMSLAEQRRKRERDRRRRAEEAAAAERAEAATRERATRMVDASGTGNIPQATSHAGGYKPPHPPQSLSAPSPRPHTTPASGNTLSHIPLHGNAKDKPEETNTPEQDGAHQHDDGICRHRISPEEAMLVEWEERPELDEIPLDPEIDALALSKVLHGTSIETVASLLKPEKQSITEPKNPQKVTATNSFDTVTKDNVTVTESEILEDSDLDGEKELPRKARRYASSAEIAEDIRNGKIRPYSNSGEIVSDMKRGIITPAEAFMFTAELEYRKPLPKEFRREFSPAVASTGDEDLDKLADEIVRRERRGYMRYDADMDLDGGSGDDCAEDMGDGDEEEYGGYGDGCGKVEAGGAGGYNEPGAEWLPDDDC